ncbi:two-component system, sensor histidine kinase and response regulator [Gammaproteobacteria bacterium]
MGREASVLDSIAREAGQRDDHILSLEIFDRSGHPLAQWKKPMSSETLMTEDVEDKVFFEREYLGLMRVVWDISPLQAHIRIHTRQLFVILMLVLLVLTLSLILLTRLIVLRSIHRIHESLKTEVAPGIGTIYAAREIRQLGKLVSTLLDLKREINRSEMRYRGLFDHMISGCLVLSKASDGFVIEDINESCRHLPGLSMGERQISRLGEILDESEVPALHEALRNTAATQVGCHVDEFALSRAGQDYWLDCHVFALDAGEMVLMIRDITESRQSRDLLQAKEAAEQANALKSAFLASMSHEIRTPLNGVLSMVELLRGTSLNGKQRHWVDAIRGSGQFLLLTINDILDFSKIEADRLHLEEIQFSLGEVITNLFNATAQRAFEKGLELVLHQDPQMPDQLLGDPFRLRQILINLVGNAIKFTERGEVEISLKARDITAHRLTLGVMVRDTGIGIAPGQIQRLFLPFEQGLVNRLSFCEGTGLGLAISKRLVEAMGGRIEVESRLGQGSRFRFEVPVGVVETRHPGHFLIPESWQGCPTLVWIAHKAVRKALIRALKSFGFKTRAVWSASDATAWIRDLDGENPAYLMVLDDSLPGDEGAKLLAELARTGLVSRALVLHVVNLFKRDQGELDRLEGLPNTAYVTKPIHASALFNALQTLFGLSSPSRAMVATPKDASWVTLIERLGARERLSGARLLLVEDNRVNQDVAVEALALAGIEVQLATHGREAVEKINAGQHFDGVLMDLQMPVMDGFQATQIIRQQHDMQVLPIIAMTAGVLFKDRQRSLEVGMNDHVGKPVNLQNLMETLMKWIKPAHPHPWPAQEASKKPLERALSRVLSEGDGVDWERVELPGLQIYQGLNQLGGNQKLYFKLLKSFVKVHDPTPLELLAALVSRDAQTLRRLAHTLKGVASTLGAEMLHQTAMRTEKTALDGSCEDLIEAIVPLLLHLEEVLHSIRILLNSSRAADSDAAETPVASDLDVTQSAALHTKIRDLLEHSDTRLQEVCTTHQTAIRAWFAGIGSYQTFMEKIEHYRFDEARQIFLKDAMVRSTFQIVGENQ